jgi:hypothetical protein
MEAEQPALRDQQWREGQAAPKDEQHRERPANQSGVDGVGQTSQPSWFTLYLGDTCRKEANSIAVAPLSSAAKPQVAHSFFSAGSFQLKRTF